MKNLITTLLACCLSSLLAGTGFAGDGKNDGEADQKEIKKEVKVNVWVDDDGKVTVDTGDGKQEIDLNELSEGGAISTTLKRLSVGGDGKVKVSGKVMIIDDEGEVREIKLGEGGTQDIDVLMLHEGDHHEGDGHEGHGKKIRKLKKRIQLPVDGKVEWHFEGDSEDFSMPHLAERFLWMHRGDDHHDAHANLLRGRDYVLGVELKPLSEMLRSHLGLDEGVGIGVRGVIEDTPAEEAGFEQHDVIVSANGETLEGYEALVAAVESAGESESTVTLGIIRAGERREIDVTPMKHKEAEGRKEVIIERIVEDEEQEEDDSEDEDDSIEEIREELRSLREALRELRGELRQRD